MGHLELATIVQRAVRRAGLAVKYSKGFNPAMRLSFDSALPVGMESQEEMFHIYLDRKLAPETILDALNRQLPAGLSVTSCRRSRQGDTDTAVACVYQVRLPDNSLDTDTVERFMAKDTFIVEDLSKKGNIRKTDLRQSVAALDWKTSHTLEMTMQPYKGRQIRPGTILKQCFGLSEAAVCLARITKKKQG